MGKSLQIIAVFLMLWSFLVPVSSKADESLKVAAAANLLYPMQEIARAFEAKTGQKVRLVFSSSGKLLTLIEQGAPFDLFFSADAKRPQHLTKIGICLEPVTYTHGILVFWTRYRDVCSLGWPKALSKVKHLAIANPKLAPYGAAAMVALKKSGLGDSLASKLVKAHTVSQAFQWAESGNAEAAMVSFSLALSPRGNKGCYLKLDQAPLICQAACLIKNTSKYQKAKAFLQFVLSPQGQAILSRYGYKSQL